MAIDRAGSADTAAGDDATGEDDTIGDLENRDDGGKEVSLPIGSMPLAAGVGDIGSTFEGSTDRAAVGDDGAAVGGTDETLAAIAGVETAAADPTAGEVTAETFSSPAFEAGWVAKAEFLSAVIRSYIRLGLVVAGREDVLAADGEDDVAQVGTTTAGCRIVEDETGLPAIVALGDWIVVAAGLVETLEVGCWALAAACLLLNNPCVAP